MTTQKRRELSLPWKLLVVGVLYFAEGVPYGFVNTTLNVYLRFQGVPLEQIGWLSLLGLAWSLKVLWSPLADRFGSRAAWLIPSQLSIILFIVALAYLADRPVGLVFWVVAALVCLASATQDLAVDAYSIDILETKELGVANGVRIGAYRVALIASGGGLVMLSDWVGWQPAFLTAAVIIAALCLTVILSRPFRMERPARPTDEATTEAASVRQWPKFPLSLSYKIVTGLFWAGLAVLALLSLGLAHRQNLVIAFILLVSMGVAVAMTLYIRRQGQKIPYFSAIVLFILLFKVGDALLGFMVAPFWVDKGFSRTEIGLVSGTFGAVATIAGGLWGGALTTRWGIGRGLWVLGAFQALSNLGYWAVALPGVARYVLFTLPVGSGIPVYPIYLASLGESFTGGMGSAAFMAFLMSLCDKRFSASQYALFAMLFGFSGRLMGYLGGWGAAHFGYADFFFVSFLAAWPAFMLLPWVLPVVRHIEGAGRED
jgi:MFS transporter, PAT family, beta-lactamase induction signal transducer AmpG